MSTANFAANNIIIDDFGRPHGVLIIDKPVGITSHDVVYRVRKTLKTRAVGHAGTLDPFASGVLIILVGKATKFSEQLMSVTKIYQAEVLLGISTNSHDPEGTVESISENFDKVTQENVELVLNDLSKGYDQTVPVFSSAKINGEKLRVLARRYPDFKIVDNKDNKKSVIFKTGEASQLEVELPIHHIEFSKLEITKFERRTIVQESSSEYVKGFMASLDTKLAGKDFPIAEIIADCTKGTYIRQLAYDIGTRLNPPQPAMLLSLNRIQCGEYSLNEAWKLEQLSDFAATLSTGVDYTQIEETSESQ